MGKTPRKQIQRDKKNFFNEKIRGIAQKVYHSNTITGVLLQENNREEIMRK